jgi:cation diffusion facilitator CzcD-associated flavoprotein CzcO
MVLVSVPMIISLPITECRRNTYPGARFDSESYSYIFSFDQSLLDEWNWSEHFAAQKETLAY